MKRRSTKHPDASRTEGEELSVKVQPFGPTQEQVQALAQSVTRHPTMRKYLARTRHRLLHIVLLERREEPKSARPKPPNRFRATFFDYSNNRTIFVTGGLPKPATLEVIESGLQPWPSEDEFHDAVSIIMKNGELGKALREQRLHPYRPMPPLVSEELPDGRVERILAVGLLPREGERGHEIVGVNMIHRKVIRFEPSERGRAPAMAAAHNPICGLPNAFQSTARGAAGSVWVTVKQGRTTVWKFLLVRPAASSGTNGSGVELRYVDYRGKRLLYRAHVPILNVKYDGDACGPFRDRQDTEGMFQANGTDVAPGFRLCPAPWRLHADGTIRPRFGFSAVQSSCVCNVHHHHPYWRLDFDIRTAGNNRVREFNDPPLIGSSNWHDKNYEIRRPRDASRKRKWRVDNKSTGESYDIIPGASDGAATTSSDWPFPRGDVWILRYRSSEIDDGSYAWGPPYDAGLDAWVNGEPINGTDIVIWYGAHFTHDVAHEQPGHFGHIVGPKLKLVKW